MRRTFLSAFLLTFLTPLSRGSNFIQPFPSFGAQPDLLVIAPDQKSGLVVAWVTSNEDNTWVGAQRVTFRGAPKWTHEGLRLDVTKFPKKDLRITSDHQGGAVFVWREEDPDMGRLWLQQIDEQGGSRWPGSGVVIASGTALGAVAIDADAQGNTAVAWEDHSGGGSSVRWQLIDPKGVFKGPPEGLPVADGKPPRAAPAVISDRMQGFVIAWRENELDNSAALMAQYYDAALKPVWDRHGMVVTTRGTQQQVHSLVWKTDNTLLVIWREPHSMGEDWEAQRMDASGRRLWGEDGIFLAEETNGQTNGFFAADPDGVLTGAWEDTRTEPSQVYVQQWDVRGLPVLDNGITVVKKREGEQRDPLIIPSGKGDFVLWRDSYDHPWDLYGQRLKSGSLDWETGSKLSPIGATVSRPQGVSDGYGGFIALWSEWVPPSAWQINILRIDGSGHLIW